MLLRAYEMHLVIVSSLRPVVRSSIASSDGCPSNAAPSVEVPVSGRGMCVSRSCLKVCGRHRKTCRKAAGRFSSVLSCTFCSGSSVRQGAPAAHACREEPSLSADAEICTCCEVLACWCHNIQAIMTSTYLCRHMPNIEPRQL